MTKWIVLLAVGAGIMVLVLRRGRLALASGGFSVRVGEPDFEPPTGTTTTATAGGPPRNVFDQGGNLSAETIVERIETANPGATFQPADLLGLILNGNTAPIQVPADLSRAAGEPLREFVNPDGTLNTASVVDEVFSFRNKAGPGVVITTPETFTPSTEYNGYGVRYVPRLQAYQDRNGMTYSDPYGQNVVNIGQTR